MGAGWRKRHEHARASTRRLQEPDAQSQGSALDAEEAWEWAVLNEEYSGTRAALDRYAAVLALDPDHAPALYAVGRLLLARKEEKGLRFVDRAMDEDPDFILAGTQDAHAFLTAEGREPEALWYQQRGEQHLALLTAAEDERSDLSPKDTYLPHRLSEAALARLRAGLSRFPDVAEAYMVRKRVEYREDEPLYVLGVVVRRPWYRSSPKKQHRKLHHQVGESIELPGRTVLLSLDNERNDWMKRVMEKRVAVARIYPVH